MKRLVLMVALALLVLFGIVINAEDAEEPTKIADMSMDTWQRAFAENRKILLLLYKTEGCKSCPTALNKFSMIIGQPEIPSGVRFGKSTDAVLAAKLGVQTFPALVFLREKSYVMYVGQLEVEPMLEWVTPASQVLTHSLGDDSFEHLTQASTGATTGDWFVAFYRPSCEDVLPMLETVGVRFRGKINVAKVNVAENPELLERFRIKGCPQLIYFRQRNMYRYEIPNLDVASLRSFLEGFYKNSKAEFIPVPKSQFDHITEGIADFLKAQLEGENRNLAIAGVCGIIVFLSVVLLVCCRSLLVGPPKDKKE